MDGGSQTVHLLVEAGPDKGRTIAIPSSGARAGRSSSNDLVLNDPSLSRFHCRFYFKDGKDLAVSDLASTNETLVNDKPIQDMRLFNGDRIAIGETVLKVTCDTLYADAQRPGPLAPAAAAGAATAMVKSEGAGPAETGTREPPAGREIDLGLQKGAEAEPAAGEAPAPKRSPRLLVVVGAVAALGVGAALAARAWLARPRGPVTGGAGSPASSLWMEYEKVQANADNVFRYAVSLRDGLLAVRIDNLADGRQITREQRIPQKTVDHLSLSIEQSGFFDLSEEYSGVVPEVWDHLDLTVTLNRRVHRVRVLNRVEPDAFRQVRENIEQFVQNEMGLYALALPPEKLRELARDQYLQGQKLFDEREVRYDNLARAIRALSDVEALLETVEPKPDYYADAISLRNKSRELLSDKYQDYLFRAERAIRSRDWKDANDNLLVVLEILQDRTDPRYEESYKKLLDVQRRLDRR